MKSAVVKLIKGYPESGSACEFDDPYLENIFRLLKRCEPEQIILYLTSVSFIQVLTMFFKSSKLEGRDLLSTGATVRVCSLIEDAGYDGYFI